MRLPLARGTVATLATAWRRQLPWYPGDWIWPTLVLLLIAALGGAIAFLATRGGPAARTIVATTPTAAAAPETTTAGTLPATAPPPPTARPPAKSGLVSWPAGTTGYTTVLQSLPARSGRKPVAALTRKAIGAGLVQVGYLTSSRFSSLHPGYYVVFSGIFRSMAEARNNAATATSKGFSEAYPRQIVP